MLKAQPSKMPKARRTHWTITAVMQHTGIGKALAHL